MNAYFLPSDLLLRALRDHGISQLYHANTVTTSSTFLRHGALLSRRAVSIKGWSQTPQNSDQLDRRFGIWNDIFIDTVDIHKRAGARNLYGPVLFALNVDFLETLSDAWRVRVTKKNPVHWKNREKLSERFFTTIQEFRDNHSFGDFDKIIVLRHNSGRLPLRGMLQRVVIDVPNTFLRLEGNNVDPFKLALHSLRASTQHSNLRNVRFEPRDCSSYCDCKAQYARSQSLLSRMFSPSVA